MAFLIRAARAVALAGTPLLTLAASHDRGWTRFFVALMIFIVGTAYLRHALAEEAERYP